MYKIVSRFKGMVWNDNSRLWEEGERCYKVDTGFSSRTGAIEVLKDLAVRDWKDDFYRFNIDEDHSCYFRKPRLYFFPVGMAVLYCSDGGVLKYMVHSS